MMLPKLKSKKAYSTAFTWVFGLIMIFGLGVLYVVFSQVMNAHLVPTIKGMVNSSAVPIPLATQTEINANIDQYMVFFNAVPFILFGVVVLYMIIAAIRREREEGFA